MIVSLSHAVPEDLFKAAYPGEEDAPMQCPIDETILLQMIGSLGARRSHASVNPGVASSYKLMQVRGNGQDQGFKQAMQFFGVMMDRMGGGGGSNSAAPFIQMLNKKRSLGNGHPAKERPHHVGVGRKTTISENLKGKGI